MQIPLSHFEQNIDETIFNRGLKYFKNGHVTSFEELSPGEFDAIVEGTEDYTVNLTVLNNNITDCSCTCPYDYGSVCKHIVAVILHLQQEESGMKQPQKKEDTLKKPASKRKTVSEQVDEMLGSLSHDDLKAFVKEQCITDQTFRRSFLSGFLYKTTTESPEKYREQMTRLEYELIKKMKGEKEAGKFIEQNLDNTDLRRKAIEEAIKNNNFDKAKSLAQDGIKNNSEDKPGLAKEWYDWLLRISVKQQDREKIIEYARYLFIDGFRHDQDYYAILKQYTETSEWTGFVEGLIAEIKRKDHWSNIDMIGKIYIAEQWWERLLGLVSGTRHLPYIQHYEQYLSDKYPLELAELYEKAITDYLKRMTGRNHYKEACRYMQRMIKLGARDRVKNLMATLRKEYPLRKALMDELNKI